MNSADFDRAWLDISESVDAYVKHLSNPDVNSVVRNVMPEIRKKYNPSKDEHSRLMTAAKRICGDAIRKAKK